MSGGHQQNMMKRTKTEKSFDKKVIRPDIYLCSDAIHRHVERGLNCRTRSGENPKLFVPRSESFRVMSENQIVYFSPELRALMVGQNF